MKNLTAYQIAKTDLKLFATSIAPLYGNDKPAICEAINLHTHELCGSLKREFDKVRLHNYACKLHQHYVRNLLHYFSDKNRILFLLCFLHNRKV